MTTKELSQLYYLSKEIAMNREHLARLEAIANSTTPQLTGMPGTVGAKDRLGKVMAEIMDVKAILELNLQKYWYEYNRLTRYIADIDDSLVRQIVKYRYEELRSWEEVAAKVGGGNKVGSLQKSLYRYLKKHP